MPNKSYEQQVIELVNQEANQPGFDSLEIFRRIDPGCTLPGCGMSQDNYFSHDTMDRVGEQAPFQEMRSLGPDCELLLRCYR